jgi:hypothetical protein
MALGCGLLQHGWSALHFAAKGSISLMRSLIELYKVNVNLKDKVRGHFAGSGPCSAVAV